MTTMNNEDPADPSPHEPRVTGSPERIWLVYGELEHDDTHANLYRDGDVTWCQHQIGASDVSYVRADAIAAYQAQDNAHRSAQAEVYKALGPATNPDRATWPDQIRALRERADAFTAAVAEARAVPKPAVRTDTARLDMLESDKMWLGQVIRERDSLREALEQIITMAERGLGLDPSSMDNYFVWIQDKARAAITLDAPFPTAGNAAGNSTEEKHTPS